MMQGKPSVLDPERQRKLEDLGFVWVVRNRPEWNNRYQELLQYREKYGDTKVPQHYKEISGLGKVRRFSCCMFDCLAVIFSGLNRPNPPYLFPVGRQATRTIPPHVQRQAFLLDA
jgi:Helicase associated domain